MQNEVNTSGGAARPGYVRPSTAPIIPTATIHFDVNPLLPEVVACAEGRGWRAQGFSVLSIEWQELHWTTDDWKTVNRLSSTDVPCPVTNGRFSLPGVRPGQTVEFALHIGLGCHATQDTAGVRDVTDLWFNNDGKNYRQVAR
jgi:hypothetical protein